MGDVDAQLCRARQLTWGSLVMPEVLKRSSFKRLSFDGGTDANSLITVIEPTIRFVLGTIGVTLALVTQQIPCRSSFTGSRDSRLVLLSTIAP